MQLTRPVYTSVDCGNVMVYLKIFLNFLVKYNFGAEMQINVKAFCGRG